MSRVTQADVLREAISHFKKPGGGFSPNHYFKRGTKPGPNVGSTCAIGGVEQAIWKLTGGIVPEELRESVAQGYTEASKEDRRTLYGGVMTKLNAKTRKLGLTSEDGDPVRTVEQMTFLGTNAIAKKRTLEVFESVLADVERRA